MTELVKLLDEYIALLVEELNELVPLASIHGWKSTKVKQGEAMRKKIKALRKQLTTNGNAAALLSGVKRFDMVAKMACGEAWQDLDEDATGEWVRFDDVVERLNALQK